MVYLSRFYVKLGSLFYDFVNRSYLYPFLVLLCKRFPAQVAVVCGQVDKFIVRLIYFLRMLYHQIAFLQVNQHLLDIL
jgi:hypothetical protein